MLTKILKTAYMEQRRKEQGTRGTGDRANFTGFFGCNSVCLEDIIIKIGRVMKHMVLDTLVTIKTSYDN